jgi:hypothetical protein
VLIVTARDATSQELEEDVNDFDGPARSFG